MNAGVLAKLLAEYSNNYYSNSTALISVFVYFEFVVLGFCWYFCRVKENFCKIITVYHSTEFEVIIAR